MEFFWFGCGFLGGLLIGTLVGWGIARERP
jgi:hypothetical protein